MRRPLPVPSPAFPPPPSSSPPPPKRWPSSPSLQPASCSLGSTVSSISSGPRSTAILASWVATFFATCERTETAASDATPRSCATAPPWSWPCSCPSSCGALSSTSSCARRARRETRDVWVMMTLLPVPYRPPHPLRSGRGHLSAGAFSGNVGAHVGVGGLTRFFPLARGGPRKACHPL